MTTSPPLIGAPSPRIESLAKVTGTAEFTGDLPYEDGLHAALVPSTIARGRVIAVDREQALATAGVVAVHVPGDAPTIGDVPFLRLLQDDLVRHRGQPVAIVLATSVEAVQDAARLVEVEYAAEPARIGLEGETRDAVEAPAFRQGEAMSCRGDPERALLDAPVRLERRYTTPTHNHNAMEPHVAIVRWDGDRCILHTTTQTLFMAKQAISAAAGVAPENVRVVCRYLGGGFGSKGRGWWPVLALVAVAARAAGRPVRLVLRREEMFALVARRQATIHALKLGADHDGRLVSIDHDCLAQTASFADYSDPNATCSRILYACPSVRTSHRLLRTDEPMPVPMRAPGEGPGSFALESAMDELAHELGIDPLELRRRNYADRDQHEGRPWSSNALLRCYDTGASAFGWAGRPLAPRSMRRNGNLVGWGMASAYYPAHWAPAGAHIGLQADGRLLVECGTQDIGTGTATIMARLVAERLGWPADRIDVHWGDTDLVEGPPSVGSMASASVAPAILAAAYTFEAKLAAAGLSAAGIATHRSGPPLPSIEAVASTSSNPPPPDRSSNAYGAIFVEAEVDEEIGHVRLTRVVAAYAAGRILNRRTALAQYQGGIVFGIGMALHEETLADRTGAIVNASLGEYLIPVSADVPPLEIHLVSEDDPVIERAGVKGVGMIGTVGTAAAIANAVFHATGQRIRDLPLRPDRLLRSA